MIAGRARDFCGIWSRKREKPMSKKGHSRKKSSSTSRAQSTRDADYGSFEVLVDGEEEMTPARPSTASRGPKRWIAAVLVLALFAIGGTSLAAIFNGDENDGTDEEQRRGDETAGFEPYGGGSAPSDESYGDNEDSQDDAAPEPVRADREPDESDSGSDEKRLIEKADSRRPDRVRNLDEREPDGEEIIEDTKGNPMSQREAQNRVEKELDSIENAEHDFEARLRRRDVELNSRVIRRADDGEGMEIAPGVEINEDVQARLKEQYAPGRGEDLDDDVKGVEDRDYDGADVDDEEEYIDDEYYDDEDIDEYDEYYDDEESRR